MFLKKTGRIKFNKIPQKVKFFVSGGVELWYKGIKSDLSSALLKKKLKSF